MSDPLLTPFQIGNLSLKNRIVSTPHAPALAEDGLPKERYQRYHLEKAKGGIAMTMIGGSSCVSPDSPSVFGQLDVSSDRIIPYFTEFAERIKEVAALSVKYHIWGVELPGMMGNGCR